MGYCNNNPNLVSSYCLKENLAVYAASSKQFTSRIINTFKQNPVSTDKLNKKFLDIAEKEGILVFPKEGHAVYDRTSTNEPLDMLDLRKSEDCKKWITNEGVEEEERTVVKHFNRIQGVWFNTIKPLHLERGVGIEYTSKWPANVTVGRVREVKLEFSPTSDLPISNLKSVESVTFGPNGDYNLTFLQQFPLLKQLEVKSSGASQAKPSLPHLEELTMENTNALVDTKNLRELKALNTKFDNEVADFISQQLRLLVLKVSCCTNATVIRFPESLNSLVWQPTIEGNAPAHVDHLVANCERLRLSKINTVVEMENIDFLDTSALKSWKLNNINREKRNGKWVLQVYGAFRTDLPVLDLQAEECVLWSNDVSILHVIDNSITKMTLWRELVGEQEELPAFKAVTDLSIEYIVSEAQANLLTRIFPQFTAAELQAKGIEP